MTATARIPPVRIGCGAGFSGDRIEPAVELAEHGDLQYLVFECLAERTIAMAHQARRDDPTLGYDPLLAARLRAVLPVCARKRIRIITNMGAANPPAAGALAAEIARAMGLSGLRIATVTGDDVLDQVERGDHVVEDTGQPVRALAGRLVSANAYLGASPIIEALAHGADLVITGRVADPALFTAPLVHAFGGAMDDWDMLGKLTVIGHLLECAGQITGGYFADPGFKDVPDLARLGFPLAEVASDGSAVLTKVAGSGGAVTPATCKEQLLYEVHDPRTYVTPDVVADFSRVGISPAGPDRVAITGGTGRPRTDHLKVCLGYLDGYRGEGQISYAGPGAVARGRLALRIVEQRLALTGVACSELRCDLIGLDAIHGARLSARGGEPYEVRARVVARTASMADAIRIGNEVEALYTNGPTGGGGVDKSARPVIAMASTLIPRDRVSHSIAYQEVGA